tara:strand:+ start:195 stop:554 length:360 start_codon:yes stop_codon:yes gene_type:complete
MQVDYYAKYLKYKQKYLDLKEEMIGSGKKKNCPSDSYRAAKYSSTGTVDFDSVVHVPQDCNKKRVKDHYLGAGAGYAPLMGSSVEAEKKALKEGWKTYKKQCEACGIKIKAPYKHEIFG